MLLSSTLNSWVLFTRTPWVLFTGTSHALLFFILKNWVASTMLPKIEEKLPKTAEVAGTGTQ